MAIPSISLANQASTFDVLVDTGRIMTAHLTVEAWISLPDHPHHRHVAQHANAIHLQHARQAKGAVASLLSHVVAACWEGVYYKVDGHTRGYLWQCGALPRPDRVHVTIYRVGSRTELDALYATFDISTALKTGYDQVLAGFRDCGLQLQSARLKQGFLSDALNIALRGVPRDLQDPVSLDLDIYRAVAVFKTELELLDGIDPQPSPFFSGVVAAALLGLALFKTKPVLDFFVRLNREEGQRKRGRSDPVDAVLLAIEKMRLEKIAIQASVQGELCARVMRGLQTWLLGPKQNRQQYWLQNAIHPANMAPVLAALKAKKEIEYVTTL